MEYNYQNNALKKTARIISVAFHPLLMPLYGMMIIFTAPTFFWYVPLRIKLTLLLIVMTDTILIPVSLLPFFMHRNIIRSWFLETRKERIAPLITVSICYIVTSYIFVSLQIPIFIKAYIFSATFVVICVTVINIWWRISVHSVAAGALLGVVFMLSFVMGVSLTWFILPVLLVTGMILTSRLFLNSHNSLEVYSGFLCGFAGISLLILIF
jgi:hypothetical protein